MVAAEVLAVLYIQGNESQSRATTTLTDHSIKLQEHQGNGYTTANPPDPPAEEMIAAGKKNAETS